MQLCRNGFSGLVIHCGQPGAGKHYIKMHTGAIHVADIVRKRKALFIAGAVFLLVAVTMALDKLEAVFNGSGFYLSESFLFSSVWWLAAPLLAGQFYLLKRSAGIFSCLAVAILPVVLHLLAYPALVWLVSELFYHHTFGYRQTFNYGLTAHLVHLAILYVVPVAFCLAFKAIAAGKQQDGGDTEATVPVARSLVVSEAGRRLVLDTADIIYISANYPYVNLHHKERRYLYSASLKSVAERLDADRFVRVHKSTIVNMAYLASYKSRSNGDYDLVMKDGSELRVSRSYASAFRMKAGLS